MTCFPACAGGGFEFPKPQGRYPQGPLGDLVGPLPGLWNFAARGPLLEDDDWRRYSGNLTKLLEAWRGQNSAPPPVKLIDGHDIMTEFHVTPGPVLRPLLEAVTESQAVGEIDTREEALALVARLLEKRCAPRGT